MDGTMIARKSSETVVYRRMTPAQRKARMRRQRMQAIICLWYAFITCIKQLPVKTYRLVLDLMARTIILCLFIAGMMVAFGVLYGALWFWCNAPWLLP